MFKRKKTFPLSRLHTVSGEEVYSSLNGTVAAKVCFVPWSGTNGRWGQGCQCCHRGWHDRRVCASPPGRLRGQQSNDCCYAKQETALALLQWQAAMCRIPGAMFQRGDGGAFHEHTTLLLCSFTFKQIPAGYSCLLWHYNTVPPPSRERARAPCAAAFPSLNY